MFGRREEHWAMHWSKARVRRVDRIVGKIAKRRDCTLSNFTQDKDET